MKIYSTHSVKINSVCMPLRYLWVFAAYIALKRMTKKTPMSSAYFFVRNATLGRIIGGWCFLLTASSCIMGIYSEDRFIMIMNIIVPLCLIGPGLIMPLIAKKNSGSK